MIILNMIVKDEAPIIGDCLQSVNGLIDRAVIVDTGSIDDTLISIIKSTTARTTLARDIWENFSHNRNLALDRAREATTRPDARILFMDADDRLVTGKKPFEASDLIDGYLVEHRDGGMSTWKINLIKASDRSWRWDGVVHEQLISSRNDLVIQALDPEIAYVQVGHSGARAKDPSRFLKDAEMLERVIEDGSGYNFRNLFLVAKSYQDAGEIVEAIRCYNVAMDPDGPIKDCKRFDETVWAAKFFKALCMEVYHGNTVEEIIQAYLQAINHSRHRFEPYLHLARFCREHNKLEMAYAVIHEIDSIREIKGSIFVDTDIDRKLDSERKFIHGMLGLEVK